LEQVDLVITNDSGPLHLAVMMGTPTISFFGPESPVQYGPRGEKHTVMYKGYYCSPCLHVYNEKNSSCEDNICLKDISVDEVFKMVTYYYRNWGGVVRAK
jgi:ADP-heptose:LPS heptosyltransferase